MSDEETVLIAIPPLVTILLNREQAKGSPLTEEEVLSLRDDAQCVAVPRGVATHMAEQRGYDDIRLENVWEDWLAIRPDLGLDRA
jgi:hypothetical protein